MHLGDILRTIGRRWYLLVAGALIGWLITLPTQYRFTADGLQSKAFGYRASGRYMVDLPNAGEEVKDSGITRMIFLPVQYTEVIQSPDLAAKVSERVHGAYTAKELPARVKAFPIVPSSVLNIDVIGDSPQDATDLLNAYSAAFQDWLHDRMEKYGVPFRDRPAFEQLSADTPKSAEAMGPQAGRWMLFGALGGFAVTLAWVLGLPTPTPRPRRAVRRATRTSAAMDRAAAAPPASGHGAASDLAEAGR